MSSERVTVECSQDDASLALKGRKPSPFAKKRTTGSNGAPNKVATPQRKRLEPSLQAWAASRLGHSLAAPALNAPRNIGASESMPRASSSRSLKRSPSIEERERQIREKLRVLKGDLASIDAPSGNGDLNYTPMPSVGDANHGCCSEASYDSDDGGAWLHSLRQLRENMACADQRGRDWKPHVTKPMEPFLRTSQRSRSRSQSRECSLEGTPQKQPTSTPWRQQLHASEQVAVEQHVMRMVAARKGSLSRERSTPRSTPDRHATPDRHNTMSGQQQHLPASEEAAMEQHLGRMIAARRIFAARQSSASPLRRKLDMSAAAPVAATMPRAMSADGGRPELSVRSQFSRPTPMSSAELEQCKIDQKRRELKALMRLNARTYRDAFEPPAPIFGASSGLAVTLPEEPQLHTARRAGIQRSLSAQRLERSLSAQRLDSSTRSEWCNNVPQLTPREQIAIERHVAHREHSLKELNVPQEVVREHAVREAMNAEECAQNARAAAVAKHREAKARENTRLCIFKPANGAKTTQPSHGKENKTKSEKEIRSTVENKAERARMEVQSKLIASVSDEVARLCVFKPTQNQTAVHNIKEGKGFGATSLAAQKKAQTSADENTPVTQM